MVKESLQTRKEENILVFGQKMKSQGRLCMNILKRSNSKINYWSTIIMEEKKE